jgi:hypothetical protein
MQRSLLSPVPHIRSGKAGFCQAAISIAQQNIQEPGERFNDLYTGKSSPIKHGK